MKAHAYGLNRVVAIFNKIATNECACTNMLDVYVNYTYSISEAQLCWLTSMYYSCNKLANKSAREIRFYKDGISYIIDRNSFVEIDGIRTYFIVKIKKRIK